MIKITTFKFCKTPSLPASWGEVKVYHFFLATLSIGIRHTEKYHNVHHNIYHKLSQKELEKTPKQERVTQERSFPERSLNKSTDAQESLIGNLHKQK